MSSSVKVKKRQKAKQAKDPNAVSPLLNLFMRATGEWPLFGSPPLSEGQYKNLFQSAPSFVDYFPLIDYDNDNAVYLFDDYVNVAKAYEVQTKYMGAKSDGTLDDFNTNIMQALNALPTQDDAPYVAQIYLYRQSVPNIGEYLASHIEEKIKREPLTQAIVEMTRQHSELLTHPKGVFPDSRLTSEKGWRLNEHKVYLFIYKKKTEKEWKKSKKTPAEQLKHDLMAFNTAMNSAGLKLIPLTPAGMINWLAPLFGQNENNIDDEALSKAQETASFDLGQRIFTHQPQYHQSGEESERGIWQFGDKWTRHLTIGGIDSVPRSGEVTLGEQSSDGSNVIMTASLFERLPLGAMLSYNIIPQPDYLMRQEVDKILFMSQDNASRQAQYATEQAEEVHNEMMRNKHKVYYAQMGLYLFADSLEALIDDTEIAISEIKTTGVIEVIPPHLDLISQDTFIRALPGVYDWAHDRKAALRARKVYTAHLASLLPFFGNKSGGENPCYIMYTRTGEPFYINPFHPKDREKVSHEVFFGPSGSGKSATIFYMTLMSMAVNNPRTFLFDYGGSFKLLADFAEQHGKKVKRIELNNNSEDVLAPFFETQKALAEAEKAKAISDGNYQSKKIDDSVTAEDDEERSYLAEMEFILRIMITGGKKSEDEKLNTSHQARIQEALIRGLKLSVEEGEAHARPIHIVKAMRAMADEEMRSESGIEDIALNLRNMADSLMLWTKGLRGTLFNRPSTGFDEKYDLTVIEIGSLGKTGGADMLAVAGLSAIYNITALAEKMQNSGRSIEMKIDEAHLWAKVPMLMDGLMVASKVFRKLNAWLCVITQDVSDFDGETSKILTNAEFWWLMKMSEKEIKQIAKVLDLEDEVKYLIKFPIKEARRFVEGVSICAKYPDTLVRYIPPSLILALAQTDGKEKEHRHKIMAEHQCTELQAAYLIAEEIEAARRLFQQSD